MFVILMSANCNVVRTKDGCDSLPATSGRLKSLFCVPTDYFATLPDEFRPSELLRLHEVVPVSAKQNMESVQYVKDRLRLLLDVTSEAEEESVALTPHTGDATLYGHKLVERHYPVV